MENLVKENNHEEKNYVASFVFAIAAVALISSETIAAEQSSGIRAAAVTSFDTNYTELKSTGRGGGGKGSCDRKRDGSGGGTCDGTGPRSQDGTCPNQ